LLEVSLLGEQFVAGSTATSLGRSSRSIALLGFLAVHADAPQPRQRLASMFWPDSTEPQAERETLRRQCVELCDQLVTGWQGVGDLGKAVEYGRLRVRLEPLEEVGYRTLMQLQANAGDRAGAISTFHKCAEILDRELQVKPSQATETLVERLLTSDDPDMFPAGSPPHARTRLAQRSRLVGRDREFDEVLQFWNSVVERRPRMLVVIGDAGVGKSRLISELAHKARAYGAVVATTRCFGMAGTVALKPVADWLRHPRIQRSLPTLNEIWRVEVDRLIPGAASLSDGAKRERPLPEPIAASRALVDAWQRHRFFEGLVRAIIAVGQPTLLVLDDLHWCDDETAAWLAFLLGRAAGAPLLVAATARREELEDNADVSRLVGALRSAGSLIEMALPPLGQDGVRALAASFLDRELSDGEASLLVTVTGGCPLHVVEALRSASDLDKAGPLPSLGNLSSLLRRRLEAASPHARDVAALASAVGRDFTLDLLTEASDLELNAVVHSVDELWRQGIFREEANGYDFARPGTRCGVRVGFATAAMATASSDRTESPDSPCRAGG
jgi:hypothetical protein